MRQPNAVTPRTPRPNPPIQRTENARRIRKQREPAADLLIQTRSTHPLAIAERVAQAL